MRGIIKTSVSTSFFSLSLSPVTPQVIYIFQTRPPQLSFFTFLAVSLVKLGQFSCIFGTSRLAGISLKVTLLFPIYPFFFFPHLSLVIFSNFLPYSFLFSSSNAPYIFFLNPCYRSSIFPRTLPNATCPKTLVRQSFFSTIANPSR